MIKNTITVNKFEKINHFLHFSDNKLYFRSDKLHKLKAVFETLRKKLFLFHLNSV